MSLIHAQLDAATGRLEEVVVGYEQFPELSKEYSSLHLAVAYLKLTQALSGR